MYIYATKEMSSYGITIKPNSSTIIIDFDQEYADDSLYFDEVPRLYFLIQIDEFWESFKFINRDLQDESGISVIPIAKLERESLLKTNILLEQLSHMLVCQRVLNIQCSDLA